MNKALLDDTLNCWKFLATLTSLRELLLDLQYRAFWGCKGWDGGLEELAVEDPGRLECLDPAELHASSDLRQQLYNFGRVGDNVVACLIGNPAAGWSVLVIVGTGWSSMGLNKYLGCCS